MAIRREADNRDRRNIPACQNRSNEYFVPKDGIDREVITADICRYLGNDALVRPGNYEAMIEDLKADSQRWDQERRAANSRGNGTSSGSPKYFAGSNIFIEGYKQSRTHETRQNLGPTGEASPNFPNLIPQPGYEQYSQSYPQPPPPVGYNQGPPPTSYMQQENHYIAGSNMALEQPRGYPSSSVGVEISRTSVPQYVPVSIQVPASQQYASPASDQCYSRSTYSQPPPVNSSLRRGREESNFTNQIATPPSSYQEDKKVYYAQPGTVPYGSSFDSRDAYVERPYPDSSLYNPTIVVANGAAPSQARREREPDPRDSRNHRDHGRRR